MRALLVCWILMAASLVASGCLNTAPDGTDDGLAPGEALLETSKGPIRIAFFCDEAPITVENFRQYGDAGFYDGTIFHRIIEDFMVQGGGVDTEWRIKDTAAPIPLEYGVPNTRGTVAMARTHDPDTAASQFFINTADNTETLGPDPQFGVSGYAVFARVVQGMDVVDAIAAVPVQESRVGDEVSEPLDPPVLHRVTLGARCPVDDASDAPPDGFKVGLIQNTFADGVWSSLVSAKTDHIPFYILNEGDRSDSFSLSIEGPSAWNISAHPGVIHLAANGTTQGGEYPYAAAAYLTVRHADLSTARDANVTITFTSENAPHIKEVLRLRLLVDDRPSSRVTQMGSEVKVDYTGRFDTGEEFDSSKRPGREPLGAEVGGPGLVLGFSYGLLGLRIGETVEIRFPPELGYGYGDPDRPQFDGEWLNFELRLMQLN